MIARRIILLLMLFVIPGIAIDASAETQKKRRKKRKKKETAFMQGQSVIQAGVGLPSLIRPETDTLLYFGEVKSTGSPMTQLRYEYGVTDNLGVGLLMGMSFAKVHYTDNTDPENLNGFDYSYFVAGARASWHQPMKSSRFDPYAVAFLGTCISRITAYGPSNPLEGAKHKSFLWSVHAGANFYVIKHLGVFAEVGYGVSVFNTGLTLKF
jgi:hypothetical protein